MEKKDQLNILWTNADPVTAEMMLFMYARNAIKHGWWDGVRVIIWGATATLVAEDSHIQDLIAEAIEAGVEFSACQSCAEKLGVKQALLDLDIEVKYWGVPLTEIIREKGNLITI